MQSEPRHRTRAGQLPEWLRRLAPNRRRLALESGIAVVVVAVLATVTVVLTGGGGSGDSSAQAQQRAPAASPVTGQNGAQAKSPDPSGAQMPSGNLPDWTLTYAQDFNGTSVPANWGPYDGTPGGESPDVAHWSPSMCSVSGGMLHFYADGINSCGVGSWANPQKYGMYLVRMKGDSEPGGEFSDIALLWPANNTWPPEIDFYEDSGGSRQHFRATVHAGSNDDDSDQARDVFTNDGTQWHTYGVQWTPTTVTFSIDGQQVGDVISKSQTGTWPDIPMVLDLQSQNLDGSGAARKTETMTVDWVAEYAYTPNSG